MKSSSILFRKYVRKLTAPTAPRERAGDGARAQARVAWAGAGASIYADMSLHPRLSVILTGLILTSGCVQNPAPIVISGPESMPAPARPADDAAVPAAAAPDTPSRYSVSAAADATLASHELEIPVAGVAPDQLEDSFSSPREGNRFHHAIDIMAPRGTPVLAADDGRVLRVSRNTLGGLTVYTIDRTGQFVYYYAHLEGYARHLAAGNIVFKGDTLGFVGTTGDAPDNLPHLHFQILRMPPDGKYWEGDPIDPFPLLSERGTRIVGNH
jgi:peptidoglycan LD-endopeptidase LytH